jgi:hypothetical protein
MGNRARKARAMRPTADVPLDKARAIRKLTSLKGRSVDVEFVPSGIEVKAETPAELERETEREVVRRSTPE